MYRLEATYRCDLFEQLAEIIWDDVADHHEQGVHLYEPAVTNQIIALIRKNHSIKNIAIWANNGINESEFGSDVDIFVESSTNEFSWYALQSKILTRNGTYVGIANKKQWDKLDHLKAISGCVPFFLFYNGFPDKGTGTMQSCSHEVSEKQYGCSIIKNELMEMLMKKYPNPKYDDLHPVYARPWRELVCCTLHRKGGTTYTLEQVKDAVSLYDGVINQEIMDRGINSDQRGNDDVSAITTANETVERQPKLSMVIRTTSGINQPNINL